MMAERNLWAEWWIHLSANLDETLGIYDTLRKEEGLRQPLAEWLEEIRRAWFEEMQKK